MEGFGPRERQTQRSRAHSPGFLRTNSGGVVARQARKHMVHPFGVAVQTGHDRGKTCGSGAADGRRLADGNGMGTGRTHAPTVRQLRHRIGTDAHGTAKPSTLTTPGQARTADSRHSGRDGIVAGWHYRPKRSGTAASRRDRRRDRRDMAWKTAIGRLMSRLGHAGLYLGIIP
jgi:hypothetical protein